MRKATSFVLAVCLLFSVATISGAASDNNDNTFYYGETEITVEGTDLSYAEMKEIADYVAGADHASTCGLMCTVFGHNTTDATVKEITHNVYTTAPKCVQKVYTVTTCSRCDYIDKELLMTTRVHCH